MGKTKPSIKPINRPQLSKNIETRHYNIMLGKSEDLEADLSYIYIKVGEYLNNNGKFLILIPGNERDPWTESELGMIVDRMPKKIESDESQIADYQAKLIISGYDPIRLGICFERKRLDDAVGSFMNGKRRKRFYREYRRFLENTHLKQFRVIVEGTYHDFLYYRPTVSRICKTCNHCKKTWKGRDIYYWCLKNKQAPEPTDADMKCDWHIPKEYTEDEIKAEVHRRRATIEGFEARGIRVSFYSTREEAAAAVKDACRQYVIKNYSDIFELNSDVKLTGEDLETLTFEVSGMRFQVEKSAVKVL